MKIYESEKYKQSIARIASKLPVRSGNVLVTGATGLIGSCIVDVLYCANKEFDCDFVIFALGLEKEILENRFKNMDSVICISQNIMDPIDGVKADYIIHAASNADPMSYARHPVETILINIIGTKNVLEMCKNTTTRVLLTSTFEVYGKSEQDEFEEEDFGLINQNQIRSCYPESKRVAEILFRAYYEEYNVHSVIARLSSIYGPTMLKDDSKAHAQFIRNALHGENIVLKSKGEQKRTYTYVMDSVSGLLMVLFRGNDGEAYNIANKVSITTIAGMAREIAELSGASISYMLPEDFERKGYSNPQNCILKTDKIEKLGWQGMYDLKTGLTETLEIMRDVEGLRSINGGTEKE